MTEGGTTVFIKTKQSDDLNLCPILGLVQKKRVSYSSTLVTSRRKFGRENQNVDKLHGQLRIESKRVRVEGRFFGGNLWKPYSRDPLTWERWRL